MDQFDEKSLDSLLNASRSDHELHEKLEVGRKYMLYSSSCIHPKKLFIEDELGLLERFEEIFFAIQSIVEIFSPKLFNRIEKIESDLNLSQNVVKLGIFNGKLTPAYKGPMARIISPSPDQLFLPEKGNTGVTPQLLLEIKTAITRLGGMCGSAAREAKEWWFANEDVFVIEDFYDPRNVSKSYLKTLIGGIRKSLVEDPSIPSAVTIKLKGELDIIDKELERGKTSWNKVLSKISQTVLILAAVTTISANLDEAYNNALKAFQYISKQSISLPINNEQNDENEIPELSGTLNDENRSKNSEENEDD